MFPVVTAVVILLYGVFYLVGSVLASLMGATESRANWIGVVVAWIAMIVVEQADAERRKGKGLARWLVIPIFFLVLIYAWKRAGQLRWVHGLSPAQLDVRRPRRGGLDAFVGATVFGAGATPSSTTGTANGQGRAEMDWDPVCGRPVDRAAGEDSVHYQGKTYYFCTAGCRRAFETDPAEYLDPSRRPST